MLDSITKKRIDDLRNILVGKIPSPQSQVEQITTGLIYKFMYDLDKEAVEMGGVPSFFVGDYEKYSWKHLFDPKLGGADKVKLYSDAIENMYNNPTALSLFREILKNSFLPFKDPSTLNMFLKEINEFHYSHSEKLGDAFEYLLSFMGSQGDAGQFRTPRHIIDFIVEIVNPQKNETILDPACGTAGFLISSYKHILSQNTDKKLGDKLNNASERKQMGGNLVGYDISPDMTRISLVNMYLHQFKSPQIHEYDTLSSEDRWYEYYDVILANPPFFSPTGGIQPHSRFGVRSKRAEVLFVDYIMEHLKPTGRAGIVVPERIIFDTDIAAYKTLRKKLVEDALVGVISLPQGVFQPYSGVKTSILILDKELNQKSDKIFFAKVENDGFSLGRQRTQISKDDLPDITEQIQRFFEGTANTLLSASKKEIQAKDFKLSRGDYEVVPEIKTDFDIVELNDVLVGKPIYGSGAKKSEFDGAVRYLRITDITDDGQLKAHDPVSPSAIEPKYFLEFNDFLIARSGSVGRSYLHKQTSITCQFAGYLIKFPLDKSRVIPSYLSYITKSKQFSDWISRKKKDTTISNINAKEYSQFTFPLPPIEVQQQIVDELEGYQKIIDGCRQVVQNYKPTIDIDPSWEMVALSEVCDFINGAAFKPSDWVEEDDEALPIVRIQNLNNKNAPTNHTKKNVAEKYLIEGGQLLFSWSGSKETSFGAHIWSGQNALLNQHIFKVMFDEGKVLKSYLFYALNKCVEEVKNNLHGGVGLVHITKGNLQKIRFPLPPIEVQQQIVDELEGYQKIIEGNLRLIEIFTKKIQDRISKVWGD